MLLAGMEREEAVNVEEDKMREDIRKRIRIDEEDQKFKRNC